MSVSARSNGRIPTDPLSLCLFLVLLLLAWCSPDAVAGTVATGVVGLLVDRSRTGQ